MLVFAFLPTIYSTLRIFYLGNIPNEWIFSIAGQLSWVSLLYEILIEAIILPLFFFIGQNIEKKDKMLNLVNVLYYGTAFILYLKGDFTPSLKGIALLFGFGLIFDFIVLV